MNNENPLTYPDFARFMGALAKAGAIIAPRLGNERMKWFADGHEELLQKRLFEALIAESPTKIGDMLPTRWKSWIKNSELSVIMTLLTTNKRFGVSESAHELIKQIHTFFEGLRPYEIVVCTPYQLGLRHAEAYTRFIERIGSRYGLKPCPPQLAPFVRQQMLPQTWGDNIIIAGDPMIGTDGTFRIFELTHVKGKLMLDTLPIIGLDVLYQQMVFVRA